MSALQDYYNLVDVYLDAVLYPNCVQDPKTFAQEGWHYELEKPEASHAMHHHHHFNTQSCVHMHIPAARAPDHLPPESAQPQCGDIDSFFMLSPLC